MPHYDVDAARRALPPKAERDPITFTIAGEKFTARLEPSFGDILDLAEAPEITPETEEQAVFALARFIERMLPEEDRQRWRSALRSIPGDEASEVIALGTWLAGEITGNPTTLPGSSAAGQRSTGGRAKRSTGGHTSSQN